MVSYIDANESVHGLVKDLFPDAKIIRNNKVERKDGVTIDIEKLDGGINNTRATIRIYTYDSREEAKSEYDMEIASTKNSFPEKFLKSSHGYYSAANHEDWSFCVFPVKFDGTKFLLPYVDQGGAYFEIHIYYENSYAIISERAEKVFKLLLPDNFRHR